MEPARTPPAPPPVIEPGHTFATITDKISAIVLRRRTSRGWLVGFGISFFFLLVLMNAVGYLLLAGIGIWGVNVPVAWGFAIVNFVWWIGIGHAGTLISAILLLLRQQWRQSINRFAEAIVFGDLNDPESRVATLKAEARNYALLAELNTRPRTTYLAAVKNPNPEIA